ncbi:MAG: M67 family metallopeptidase [Nitrospirae bacterium]|nr:M67 family metallopeptidase [Nitrospirota bacterium]
MKLDKDIIEEICKHALETYPEECCGIITGGEHGQTVHRCNNIQNSLHAEDPERFPRDARTAYVIDRKEFEDIIVRAKTQGNEVVAFYHSHPEHEAYFSAEDAAAQTVFGEPEFPDAAHVVVSVIDRKVHDIKCYGWDRDRLDFIILAY